MARGRISTICHHGAPIRVPKRRCIPLQQPNFAQPLSKWVKNSDAFLKLSYKTFFVSTNLVCCQVMYIEHLSPWGPPNNKTYPCNSMLLLSHFLKIGERVVISRQGPVTYFIFIYHRLFYNGHLVPFLYLH